MIEIKNIKKTYSGPQGTQLVFDNLSVTIESGRFAAVNGPSGSGKSTLLLICGGLLSPDSGTVLVDNNDLYKVPTSTRTNLRSSKIGFVFQEFHLIPYCTVRENILAQSVVNPSTNDSARADELIEKFQLSHRAHHHPSMLSTGEKQRVALARALLKRPKVLLADEPTGNLDQVNAEIICKVFSDFVTQGGAVLLVTHDPRIAAYATEKYNLDQGKLVKV